MFRHSWATLTNYGNIASAVVLDALRRMFDEGLQTPGTPGLIAGFGPGITAEMAVGSWTVDPASSSELIARDDHRGRELVHAAGRPLT